jgi:Wiskott-Aldrich syndrome protein
MSLSQAEISQFSRVISDEVITITVARLYECTGEWRYRGLWGAICLLKTTDGFAFKLLDFNNSRMLWEHVLADIKYAQDLPHFHSFMGKSSVMGLSFASDKDAQDFARQVLNRESFLSKRANTSPSIAASPAASSESKEEGKDSKSWFKSSKKKEKKKIDKSMISAPENFQHLSHVGFDPKTGFSASNIPMEWKVIFQKAGITEVLLF